jgi:DNA replication protein DnaC
MSIVRAPRPTYGFLILRNEVSNDKRLSWAARGLLVYLLSKPDDWNVSVAQLVAETKESDNPLGRDGVYKILKQLIDAGYVKKIETKNKGQFSGIDYIVSDDCEHHEPFTDSPLTDLADTALPLAADPPQLITINKLKTINNKTQPDGFDDFWKDYARHDGKANALKAWGKLKKTDRDLALSVLNQQLAVWKKEGTEKQFIPHASTWLNGRRFEDFSQTPDKPKEMTEDERKNHEALCKLWRDRLSEYKETKRWLIYWGRFPDHWQCTIPNEVLIEYGYEPRKISA